MSSITSKRSLLQTSIQLSNSTLKNKFHFLPVSNPRRWKSESSSSDKDSPDGTFKADELEIELVPDEKLKKKPEVENLKFGKNFTDYMLAVRWNSENGWGTPKIEPVTSFRIHPASKCLQYGVQLFEGMKAYRGTDNNIRLFRPDLNMQRLLKGAGRMVLPSFDPNEFIDCIKRLVKLENEWVPNAKETSLYIRPTYIGTDGNLGVTLANSALLYVLLCPFGPYFTNGYKPVSILADPKYTRSWPGGCGDIKAGGNYGPTIYVQRVANQRKLEHVLWLYGKDHEILEMGTMNVFIVVKTEDGGRELVTPPINGMILSGVTRQSILDLARDECKEMKVSERSITMNEIIELINQKKLREMFSSGTSAVVCPISSIHYEGSKYDIPTVKQDKPVHLRLRNALLDIYYGKVPHPWGVVIE